MEMKMEKALSLPKFNTPTVHVSKGNETGFVRKPTNGHFGPSLPSLGI